MGIDLLFLFVKDKLRSFAKWTNKSSSYTIAGIFPGIITLKIDVFPITFLPTTYPL